MTRRVAGRSGRRALAPPGDSLTGSAGCPAGKRSAPGLASGVAEGILSGEAADVARVAAAGGARLRDTGLGGVLRAGKPAGQVAAGRAVSCLSARLEIDLPGISPDWPASQPTILPTTIAPRQHTPSRGASAASQPRLSRGAIAPFPSTTAVFVPCERSLIPPPPSPSGRRGRRGRRSAGCAPLALWESVSPALFRREGWG
jgi:hypothetical protein